MAWTRIVPTVAALSLAGVVLGVHLGQAAIGAIDPFYFSMPQGTQSYAALVPAASRTGPATDFEPAARVEPMRAVACIGCGPPPVAAPEQDGFADGYAASAWRPVETPSLAEPGPPLDRPDPQRAARIEAEREFVRRYAYYPVSDDAARAHEAAVAAVVERTTEAVSAIADPFPDAEADAPYPFPSE